MKQIRFLIQSALVFFIIATMVSCQPEDFNKELQTITTDTFIVTEKKLQDLKNDPLFSPVYSKIVKEESSFSNNTLFRTMIPTDNGYILISDSKVKVSEFSGITSYTFPIKNISLDSLSFQNLIVNKFPGQEFRYYIATYTPTEESEETHFGEESFEGEKNIVEITIEEGYFPITSQQRSGGYSPCNLTVLKWCDNDGSGGYGATHPAGENCTSHNHTWYELVQSGDCSNQNSYVSQVQDLIDNIVSAGGGGNGGGSPQNPNNPISNNPVPVNPENPTTPGFSDGDGFIITTPIKPLDAITAQSTFFDVLSTNVNYRNWWNHEQNWLATDFTMSIFTVNNNTNSNIRNINKAAAFAESLVGFCVNNNQPLYGTSALINIISQILQSDNYSPVNLTPEQKGCLNDSQNQELALHIYSYLAINGLNPTLYNSPKTFNQESWEFAKNLIQLYVELGNNPSFLLEIPYTQLQKWQQLIQHQVPQNVINKIRILDQNGPFGDFQIQYLEEAKGNVINLDYFSVNITSLPNNPLTGFQFTPEGFLNHIRLNINNFINTNYSEFSPSTITGMNEAQIWNSNDPLSAIIHIDIPAPAGDGSVICSQHDSNSWIFTTIEVPWRPFSQEYDGIHPVSGHRQFGIVQNSNGSYNVFTRGVDRMTDKAEAFFAETFIEYPFEAPDNLWNSFREGVYNFVNNNGGNASSLNLTPPEIWRPNWNKVKEVLQGLRPISDLETD